MTGEVIPLGEFSVRDVFVQSMSDYAKKYPQTLSRERREAASSILGCKTGVFGFNAQICKDCFHLQIHYCSCGNRNCPQCQQVKKEKWIDQRRAEVMDTPYFHVVFTLPQQLRALFMANQKLLYNMFHRIASQTLLKLARDDKYLGATPAIIQVLHTWTQTLDYHPHMHCIVSAGGLTRDLKFRKGSSRFFIPIKVLMKVFRGKFMEALRDAWANNSLVIPASCSELELPSIWKEYCHILYETDWCPYVKETFNGFGNAIDYLGRYTHKIAISNSRIIRVTDTHVTFWYRDRKDDNRRKEMTLENTEFIRRFLMHVLPKGFQKIRYFGILHNSSKKRNLNIIFQIQGKQSYQAKFSKDTPVSQVLKELYNIDICRCEKCGSHRIRYLGRFFRK